MKARTHESYAKTLQLHILPVLGTTKVRLLHRGRIKSFLVEKLREGKVKKITEGGFTKEVREPLARDSVRIIHATLRAMLNAAVDDGVLVANPADRLGRQLRLVPTSTARQENIKAMTREQVSAFLKTAWTATDPYARRCAVLFLLLARTGIRLGEALAVQWDDVDLLGRELRVVRAFSGGRIDTPKSGHGRTVDMSDQIARALLRLQVERKAETLKQGWAEMPKWVFCTDAGSPLDESRVRKVFSRVLKAATLPPHFSPHCLRHTFASLLLQQGESPAYVQRQLGHASIQLTVDTYGKWLPMGNKAAVNRLDDQSGSKSERRPGGRRPST